MRRRALLVLLLTVAACAPLPPPAAPEHASIQTPPPGAWRIDGQASLLTIVVRRGGALSSLGHDHVIAVHQLHGWADPRSGTLSAGFALDQMTVDEEALRQAAQLEQQPSPQAIAGTRTNMLDKVLDARRYPDVRIDGSRSGDGLDLRITLHGQTRTQHVPARIDVQAGSLQAHGRFTIRQSDFGVVPMQLFGGALRVQDQLELEFDVRAAP